MISPSKSIFGFEGFRRAFRHRMKLKDEIQSKWTVLTQKELAGGEVILTDLAVV